MEYKGKNLYCGNVGDGNNYRKEYLSSIERLIERRMKNGNSVREKTMTPEMLVKNPEYFRHEYLKMIGFPFDLMSEKIPKAEMEYIGNDDMCKLYRVSIEVAEDFLFYGILMLPHESAANASKVPLVIAQHGGGGTPESCSDMCGENNYNFFTKRALEHGFVVFAPSIALWNFNVNTGEKFPYVNIPFERSSFDIKLRKCGYSITGVEVFCIMRSIDWLCTLECVDKNKIGMMGLSYGGYFSMHTAAADTRIVSAYNAGSFNDRNTIYINDWSYQNAANLFHDAEVAALCAPRRLQIDVGKNDTVFDYIPSQAEAEKILKYYKAYGAEENFVYNLWDGGHRFDESCSGFDYFFDGLK